MSFERKTKEKSVAVFGRYTNKIVGTVCASEFHGSCPTGLTESAAKWF